MKFLILLFIPVVSFAHEPTHTTINNNTVSVDQKGIALAIASSQLTFDAGTHKSQVSIGAGVFKGRQALSVGVGKKIGSALVNGSVSMEGGDIGVGAGFHMKF